jgi:hypothetical protein
VGTILASASQADSATTTSNAYPFDVVTDIVCTCANSSTAPPSQPSQVILQLSSDNTNYTNVDRRWFGLAPGITYEQRFELADYINPFQSAWTSYKIQFTGNVGAAVTIAATDGAVWSISGNNYSVAIKQGHPQFISTAWTSLATPAQTVIPKIKIFLLARVALI